MIIEIKESMEKDEQKRLILEYEKEATREVKETYEKMSQDQTMEVQNEIDAVLSQDVEMNETNLCEEIESQKTFGEELKTFDTRNNYKPNRKL